MVILPTQFFKGIFFVLHSTCVISKGSNLSGFRLERNIVNLELMYFIRFLFNAKIIAEIILLIYYRIHCDYEFEKLYIFNCMKY